MVRVRLQVSVKVVSYCSMPHDSCDLDSKLRFSQEADQVLSPADTIEKAGWTESQAYKLYPYIETPNAFHQCIIFHTKKVKLNQVDWTQFLNYVTR